MIARTTKTVCELVGGAILGIMLLAGIAGWRLAQGPVPLDFLTPHLVRALNGQGSPYRVTIGGTNLAWAGWHRTLDIRVVGVRAVAAGGRVVANVPEMSVGLSVRGLLRGIVAPTGIDVIGPAMRLERRETGELALALGDARGGGQNANPEVINRLILAVQSAPNPDRPVTYLRRIRILNAQLVVDDRLTGTVWGAPQADVVLTKERGELRGSFFARLEMGDSATTVNGAATWRPDADVIHIESEFSGLNLDRVAAKLPAFKGLEAAHLRLLGRAELTLSIKGFVQRASFELRAGAGRLAFDRLWPEGLPVTSAQLGGWFDGETERLEIEHFTADIGGAKLTGHAAAIRLGDGVSIDGTVRLDRLSLAKLEMYWPQPLGRLARRWVIENMPSGEVEDASVTVAIGASDLTGGDVSLEALSGTLKFRDATVHHVQGLPPVTNVAASAVFSRDRFIARFRHGESAGLTVTGGELRLTELQSDNEQAAIDVTLEGSLKDALTLIDRPPLRYASRFGLQPASVTGRTETRLRFKFPLIRKLPLAKVEVQTESRLSDARVPNLAFGQTVSAETLTLKVNSARLELAGRAKLGEVNAAIKWTELFTENEKFPRRYEVRAVLSQAQRDSLGLVSLSPYLEGPLGADVSVLQPRAGPSEIVVKLALEDAKLWLPGFRWRKPAGRDGVAWLRLHLAPDGTLSIPEFSVRSPGLTARGSMAFDRLHNVVRMEIGQFTLGRTDLSARIAAAPGGAFNVDISGAALDAVTFLSADTAAYSGDGGTAAVDRLELPPVNLQLNIDRAWFNDANPVDRLTGSLERVGTDWHKVNLSGLVGGNQKVTLHYARETEAETMVVRSDNAGDALRAMDVIDTVQGGTMILRVAKKGHGAADPWNGSLNMSDFVLVKAPVMAKILTIASFTGIGDTLNGKGIRFAKLEAPFEFRDGIATIKNARTVGAELGFTAEGTIDTKSDAIKMGGTIVPAYTLNSVLGKIPFLGAILTGKNRSGIFAATYRIEGPLEKPDISVNPLAALAPGFLRNLISVFDGSGTADKNWGTPLQDNE